MIPTDFAKSLKSKASSLLLHPERINERNCKTAERSDVINADGKLNERLPGLVTTDVLLPVGNETIKCIKLFSISLVR